MLLTTIPSAHLELVHDVLPLAFTLPAAACTAAGEEVEDVHGAAAAPTAHALLDGVLTILQVIG